MFTFSDGVDWDGLYQCTKTVRVKSCVTSGQGLSFIKENVCKSDKTIEKDHCDHVNFKSVD